jgi:hypothetical protein
MAEDIQTKAAELVKKVLTLGIGAIFLTEESLRNLAADFKLPKELLTGILASAGKTKNEFFQKLSTDVLDSVAGKMDPKALIEELMAKNEVELTIRINLKPKNKS